MLSWKGFLMKKVKLNSCKREKTVVVSRLLHLSTHMYSKTVIRRLYSRFLKIAVSFSSLILGMTALSQTFAAQSEEEMKILRMFYEEKDLVVSPTRNPKPISQVAENITVVTAREIEEMNAHTVAEVLNRVPGVFVVFNQGIGSFGSTSLLQIQGSEERHVLVLVDDVPWNFLSEGSAETNSIPVGIIERIEVIKGPASSAWGSSLGGVVNIITKPAGTAKRPTGSIRGSYGEKDTQDYRAEASGSAGPVGYYVFAGRQDSDGLMSSRYFENDSFYSKFRIPLSKGAEVGLSMGYSHPEIGLGDYPSGDITSTGASRAFFTTASLDASLTRELGLNVSFYRSKQKFIQMNDALGLGFSGPPGELYLETIYDEETTGGGGKLVWTHGMHTAVLGVDIDHGKLDQTLDAGPLLQSMGVPATSTTHPDIEKWALFANDTIVINRWSFTPGIRYDHNSITGSFVSPSLGATYRLGKDSIARASAARGFTIPPLSWTSGGGLFLDPNPSLEAEKVWSYQAGVESAAFGYLWVKATVFRHELEDALILEPFGGGPPAFNDLIVNNGDIRRQGLELEAETVPMYNLSLVAGFAYVNLEPANEVGSDEIYTYNIGFRYDDKESFRAQLFGHYVWWDSDPAWKASYDDFIWDLNLNKRMWSKEEAAAEVFVTGHNIFNGSQYIFGDIKNPGRWVEAGIRVSF
jgi:vitamin B12 transporter